MHRLAAALGLVFVLEIILWLAPTVHAQGTLTLIPSQVTLAGTRCYSLPLLTGLGCSAAETRTVLLQTTQPITQPRIIALDLVRTDNLAIIPAAAISATLNRSDLAANQPVTIPISVDFRDAPSGQFSGILLLNYYGGSQNIPLTVSVKDPWLAPLIVLLLGVLLGIGVGAYRASGRDRDRVRVQVGQLRALMRADAELPAAFRDRVEGYLAQVDIALQGDQSGDAQTALAGAGSIWKKWRSDRANWIAQMDYQAGLAKRCEGNGDLAKNIPYSQALCRAIGAAGRTAPDLENPGKLREKLDALIQQINTYLQLQAALDTLRNRVKQLQEADAQNAWRDKINGWQTRLDLQTTDKLDSALEGEITAGRAALEQALEAQPQAPGVAKDAIMITRANLLQGPPVPFEAAPRDQTAQDAERRLQLFTFASYAIAVTLLAGVGFNELYVAKATFGAAPWGDYFGLLAWGFGAEATRQAIAGLLKTWGLPGVDRQT